MDHSRNVFKKKQQNASASTKRPSFELRTDEIEGIAKKFWSLASRRLVILGDASSGKTTLALLLLYAMLQDQAYSEITPIILSLEGWDPDKEDFQTWIARRIAEEYPALQSNAFGPDVCSSLVKQRKLLPILDGLDELQHSVRVRVVAALNSDLNGDDPLVVTCRTREFQRAIKVPGAGVLRSAATIEPRPVSPVDACNYLQRSGPLSPPWEGFYTALRDIHSPIAKACSSPLTLWLLRKVYIDTNTDPERLLQRKDYPSSKHITDHLLDEIVNALIRANPPDKNRDNPRPFQPRNSWEPKKAEACLQFLAHHLQAERTHDLAWWKLWKASEIKRMRSTFSMLFAAMVYLTVIYARFPYMDAIPLLLDASALGAMAFFVARRSFNRVANKSPAYADLHLKGRSGELLRMMYSHISFSFPLGAFVGLVGFLGYGLGFGLSRTWPFVPTAMTWFGLLIGGSIGISKWAETPQEKTKPATPRSSLRNDVLLAVFKGTLFGSAAGTALGLAFSAAFGAGLGVTSGIMVGLIAGPVGAVMLGSGGTCVAYWLAVGQLRRNGCPKRLMKFLEDARRLGLLRGNGMAFQFRSSDLRDRLASRYSG